MEQISIDRLCKALDNLNIGGAPRERAISDAICAITVAPTKALMGQYIGVKNYAGFGDQREDHEYGMGPRHGTIVFRIERTRSARDNKTQLGLDEIYLLECYRDFGVVEDPDELDGYNKPKQLTLIDVIRQWRSAYKRAATMRRILDSATVDSHESAGMIEEAKAGER